MFLLTLGKHLIWSRPDGKGGTISYYYYDEITWAAGAVALAWLVWYFVRRYRRALSLRRPPRRRARDKALERVVKIKSELSAQYLQPGFSVNIHAVGVGRLGREYCIQVFVSDPDAELWAGAGGARLPGDFRGVPLVLIEMPVAGFLSDVESGAPAVGEQFTGGIRERQEVIIGGISGANTNLAGQSGTIGYFCTRKSRWTRRKEIHLLSNSHVFADLRKGKADENDLILQPSPGELASNRPIGALVHFSSLKFDGDINEPNHVDAAIARLWVPQQHNAVLPLIGAVKGHVAKKDVEVGEAVRKFGRTTGYTQGRIFSIYLDIWIRYDRTGQSAFFQNQFLIEPSTPEFPKFVAKGDSGSLLIDAQQYAVGLIFAGMSEEKVAKEVMAKREAGAESEGAAVAAERPVRIESYGVANPISEVLERLRIELLV